MEPKGPDSPWTEETADLLRSTTDWSTTEHDIDVSADAIVHCFRAAQAARG